MSSSERNRNRGTGEHRLHRAAGIAGADRKTVESEDDAVERLDQADQDHDCGSQERDHGAADGEGNQSR